MKRIISLFMCIVLAVTCFCVPAEAAKSKPSVPAPLISFYEKAPLTHIRIMNEDLCTIRYTLDGTAPNSSSAKFPKEALTVRYPSNGYGVVKKCLKLLVSKSGYESKIFTYYFGIKKTTGVDLP